MILQGSADVVGNDNDYDLFYISQHLGIQALGDCPGRLKSSYGENYQ